MGMNYQKYLMEIGAAPKLVQMAAVVKNIEKIKPQPTKEQIAITDNGNIVVMTDSTIIKIYLNGDEAVIEMKEIDSDLILVKHIDKYGIEYLIGQYGLGAEINGNSLRSYGIKNAKIETKYGYAKRKGKLIEKHDSAIAIMIQDGDWGGEHDHDGSCFLQEINRNSFGYVIKDIQDQQIKNMVLVMTKFPLSIQYYLDTGYITTENMAAVLLKGISQLIETYEAFIEGNGKSNYPAFIGWFIKPKTPEQIKTENDAIRLEIVKYKEIAKKITNGEKIQDATEGYTEEIASQRRKASISIMKEYLINSLNNQKRITEEYIEKYERYVQILKKLSSNIIFKNEANEVYKSANNQLKKELSELADFVSDISFSEIYETLIGLKVIEKMYKNALNIVEKFFQKYDMKSLQGKYLDKIVKKVEQSSKETSNSTESRTR